MVLFSIGVGNWVAAPRVVQFLYEECLVKLNISMVNKRITQLHLSTMTTLTSAELSTRLSSLWKGYCVRKIFSDLNAVNSWAVFDSLDMSYIKKIETIPSLSYQITAWDAALDKTYDRLTQDYYYPDDEGYGETGLDWNESGYFD
jgi:hypothetical protein